MAIELTSAQAEYERELMIDTVTITDGNDQTGWDPITLQPIVTGETIAGSVPALILRSDAASVERVNALSDGTYPDFVVEVPVRITNVDRGHLVTVLSSKFDPQLNAEGLRLRVKEVVLETIALSRIILCVVDR